MRISGHEKLTLTDYPGHIATIVFTQGCNFRCPFCQNSTLLSHEEGLINENDIFSYLEKRKCVLEGVVVSGGEPTLQKDLKLFLRKIKELNLKVKLDTNGSNYEVLKDLIDEKLVDYVAMDVKNTFDEYDKICGVNVKIDNIKKSIALLREKKCDYEFRTTIVSEFHDIDKILKLCNEYKNDKYFLQNFRDSENVLLKNLHSFTESELKEIKEKIQRFKNVNIR